MSKMTSTTSNAPSPQSKMCFLTQKRNRRPTILSKFGLRS
ncbi:hypothetical protein Godav_028695 [Gossypium davidsonii]|uniref:Uncharacterized protein n=1 Tax=Gossypium davidsonii TaxID=34287 RepID=A0A7J8S1P8_GOSDV|nr:hypothetical protein [Gossypium davidsonii]